MKRFQHIKSQAGSALAEGLTGILMIAFFLGSFAAWATHLYVCFNTDRWGFLIAGALFFPVAMIHGVGLWFGFWQ